MTKYLFFSSVNPEALRPIPVFSLKGMSGHTGMCAVVNTEDPGKYLSMGLFIFICNSYIYIFNYMYNLHLPSFGFPKVCQGCYYD